MGSSTEVQQTAVLTRLLCMRIGGAIETCQSAVVTRLVWYPLVWFPVEKTGVYTPFKIVSFKKKRLYLPLVVSRRFGNFVRVKLELETGELLEGTAFLGWCPDTSKCFTVVDMGEPIAETYEFDESSLEKIEEFEVEAGKCIETTGFLKLECGSCKVRFLVGEPGMVKDVEWSGSDYACITSYARICNISGDKLKVTRFSIPPDCFKSATLTVEVYYNESKVGEGSAELQVCILGPKPLEGGQPPPGAV